MDDDRAAGLRLTRRQLLVGSAALAAGWATGCSSDDPAPATTTGEPPDLGGDPFTLGVASGDPLADAVVIWTRLAPEPLAIDGLGGMPDEPVEVTWEVATDDGFTDVVADGTATAEPAHAHSVHVDVTGLTSGTDYRYRFRVGASTSPVGRTRTLPTSSPDRFGLAVVNCQWFETGAYAAYRHLVDEDLDLVLHLGDYIYEYAGTGEGAGERSTLPTNEVESLADYRLRYASYKIDGDLQGAHARYPFMLTWDDHEVANNYMGRTLPAGGAPEYATDRRAAAYRAWWEHLPVRTGPPNYSDLVVHQHVDVGDLARIYLLDERQYSDVPPCRDEVADDFGDCTERTAERTRLGPEQERWLAEALGNSRATWNLVGNPVVLAGVDGGNAADGAAYYLDTWDGFPTARHRLIEQLAAVDNPVVLTGDYHAGMVLDVRERPFDPTSTLVAPELMAPPISSPLFAADVTERTPQVRQQINGHGYLTVTVERARLTAAFRLVDDVADPASGIATAATYEVAAGSPVATAR